MAAHIREGVYVAELRCPLCGSLAELAIGIWPRLVVDHDGMRIGVRTKATPVDHVCGRRHTYRPDGQIEGQTTIDDHLTPEDVELEQKIRDRFDPAGLPDRIVPDDDPGVEVPRG
jgi:hypothetical protein